MMRKRGRFRRFRKGARRVGKEVLLNAPNMLTFFRILLVPLVIYCILRNVDVIVTSSLFLVSALTDLADGIIARKFNQTTKFGAKFDMAADRIFFTSVILALGIKFFTSNFGFFGNDMIFIFLLSREIVAFPIFIFSFFWKGPYTKVKFVGKLTTFMQGVTVFAILINFPYTLYLAYATGIIGIFAAFVYWQDIIKGNVKE